MGYEVISVDEYTSHPEILEGRVKTLHPKFMEAFYTSVKMKLIKTILDLNISLLI